MSISHKRLEEILNIPDEAIDTSDYLLTFKTVSTKAGIASYLILVPMLAYDRADDRLPVEHSQ